jgi:hypothetical protein
MWQLSELPTFGELVVCLAQIIVYPQGRVRPLGRTSSAL